MTDCIWACMELCSPQGCDHCPYHIGLDSRLGQELMGKFEAELDEVVIQLKRKWEINEFGSYKYRVDNDED